MRNWTVGVGVCLLMSWVGVPSANAGVPYATLSGSGPLSISVGQDLSCQVQVPADSGSGEFYPAASTPGDCGTFLALGGTLFAPDFGSHDKTATGNLGSFTPFSFVDQSPMTGDGSVANPFTITTTESAGDGVQVAEADSYLSGARSYQTTVTIRNSSPGEIVGTLYRAGDCYTAGSDQGYGALGGSDGGVLCGSDSGSPPTRSLEWIPRTAGSSPYEDLYSNVWSAISTGGDFAGSCLCDGSSASYVDDGAGLSWPVAIPAGRAASYTSDISFGGQLVATATPASPQPTPAPTQTASSGGSSGSTSSSPSSQPLCDPGSNTSFLHIFKVTITCLVSGEAFYDPALKLKNRCIASVGFDVLTDLIPAGKVKLLKNAAKPIGKDGKALAAELKKTKKFDKSLLDGLDNLGKAMTLITHHPKDLVGLFVTSDRTLKLVAKKLGKNPKALSRLKTLQTGLKGLFLSLTGYDDVEKCVAAFS